MTAGKSPGPFDAFVVERDGQHLRRGLKSLAIDDLPPGDVLVEVSYSSVNYKDALASSANGKVARAYPLVPGIDLVGTVMRSEAPSIQPGMEVLAHGYEIGVSRHGGYSRFARLPSQWVLPLPDGLSPHEAMSLGTAGFTAAMSVVALQDHFCVPGSGKVLVTGASGGVGAVAIAMLAQSGYDVVASTGKQSCRRWLSDLGAGQVIDRTEVSTPSSKALAAETWAGAIDCVGGTTLQGVLASLRRGGVVAACGMAGGTKLETTVFPFILRGISLVGMDSAEMPAEKRLSLWSRIATELKPTNLSQITKTIALEGLEQVLDGLLEGEGRGRVVVDLRL